MAREAETATHHDRAEGGRIGAVIGAVVGGVASAGAVNVVDRTRAHALYEQRGYRDGHDVQDWLEAEREVQTP